MWMNAIEVRGLAKNFGSLLAVDHIDFDVAQGEVFGLLGPNGAGKTTTIRMLTTLLQPSAGTARVWGYDVRREAARVREVIGVVFQEPALDLDLTGEENMRFHGRLYGLTEGEIEERTRELLELVGLSEWGGRLVKTYSGGMRRRLEVARALVHRPKVLFLDEPTLGLDPNARRKIWDYIRRVREEWGITIVLTTHYMEEADQLCDRVAIIDGGCLVAVDSPGALKSQVGGDVVSLVVGEGAPKLMAELRGRGLAEKVQPVGKGEVRITVRDGSGFISTLFGIAREVGVEIKSVNLRQATLDDVFLHFTGKRLRGEGPEPSFMMRMRMQMMKKMAGGR